MNPQILADAYFELLEYTEQKDFDQDMFALKLRNFVHGYKRLADNQGDYHYLVHSRISDWAHHGK